MAKVLVPVDGSKTSARAVRHVVELAKTGAPLEVHLVNVQEAADAPELRRFKKVDEIKRAQLEHGAAVLETAKRLLDRARVPCKTHVLLGDPAARIITFARRGGFDRIIMGTHGRGALAALLMGSVATKVLHHARVPVTLDK